MVKNSETSSMASASSPSSPSHSAPAFIPASRPPLPVMALRAKIVEKIQENRVTLIVGDTGCGKSSQVPLFLIEENMQPILCTQPRRFAVVAIARMVAKARNCEIGGEIGYHIGHSNVSDITSTRSRIVFKTAGVLLEQMRDKGAAALKYKVIILDEVHERSVESDLVLACVKQFMLRNHDLRVVLMSATADIARYRDYFKDLGRGERVEVVAIPSASQHSIFQRKVLYLEQSKHCQRLLLNFSRCFSHGSATQVACLGYTSLTLNSWMEPRSLVTELLGIDLESLSAKDHCGLSPSSTDADMKPEIHTLIHKLVLHIHENEPDIEKSILIFLPTYYSLEQQWIRLKPLKSLFKVHILHRSIDTDQALLAMRISKSHRKVILATNIAESSVTIPGVAYVIDSCRSLQIFWDSDRKKDSSELVWESKSQAEQRKGRTGRTCDGQIYRLVTGKFYNNLSDHEYPAILRLSLRQQVLMICCAESKSINDPKGLLQKVMDPPEPEIVEDALSLLVHIHALEKPLSHRGRYEPTFYGRLLDSLPLSFDAAMLTLKFGEIGFLREGILLSIFMDVQPLPIFQPFGHPSLFAEYVDNYFDSENNLQTGKKETVFMGNLCAFQFWQRVFKDKHRLERLKQILKVDEPKSSHSLIPKLEEEWCLFHNLVHTSLHNVSEIYEDIINTMHRYRPGFFATNGLPSYCEPYAFKHTCLLQSELAGDLDTLTLDEENLDSVTERRKCIAVPYLGPNDFQATTVSTWLKTVIKELRVQYIEDTSLNQSETASDVQYTEDTSLNQGETASGIVPQATDAPLCRFFISGLCNKGKQCCFSHSLRAKRPLCKFFLTFQGCRYGDSCFFSHDSGPSTISIAAPTACLQEEEICLADSFLQLLPGAPNGRVLVLNDRDLYFSSILSHHYDPTKIISTTTRQSSDFHTSSSDVTVLWDVSQPCRAIIEPEERVPIPWREVHCVLLFADVEADDVNIQHRLLQNFFEFLAIRVLAETLFGLRVIITMNNIRFAQLQVEKLGRESFFYLTQSFPFDESSFGKLSDSSCIIRPMQVSTPISYVFAMYPPSDIQFGDYVALLRQGLYNNQ